MQRYCHNGQFQKRKQPASPRSSSSSSDSFPALDISTVDVPVPAPVPVPKAAPAPVPKPVPKPKPISKGKAKQPQAKRIREEATTTATISPSTLDARITSKVGQMMDERLAPLLEFLKHPRVQHGLLEKAATPPKEATLPKAASTPRPTATVRISPLRASESDDEEPVMEEPVMAMSFSDEEDASMEAAKQCSHQAAAWVTGETGRGRTPRRGQGSARIMRPVRGKAKAKAKVDEQWVTVAVTLEQYTEVFKAQT